jgi:hypothetical protein
VAHESIDASAVAEAPQLNGVVAGAGNDGVVCDLQGFDPVRVAQQRLQALT